MSDSLLIRSLGSMQRTNDPAFGGMGSSNALGGQSEGKGQKAGHDPA